MARKKKTDNVMITEDLLQRLDKMDDEEEYNPYKATKKTTVTTEELFSDDTYQSDSKQESGNTNTENGNANLIVLVIMLFIALVAFGVFIALKISGIL